jgi:SAM-dependent methyltransferase
MSSVRMGERALQIGVADASLVGAIASKVGMSGHAAVAVEQERDAEKARSGAASAGALVDVTVAPLDALPFPSDSFDVVVMHPEGLAQPVSAAAGLVSEAYRVLRAGGRLVIIEGRGVGFAGRVRGPAPADASTTLGALDAAGFKATRVLAEREGYRFIEGIKHQP